MAFSTASIHLSCVELDWWEGEDASMRKKLWVSLKTALIFIPFVIFKAGALAIIFAELKYGGLAHLTVWIFVGFMNTGNDGQSLYTIRIACSSVTTNMTELKQTRMSVWLTFFINTMTLILCYSLSQFATGVTFHDQTNCWLRENVHLVVASLIALGLCSCALFELYAKFKLHWLTGDEEDRPEEIEMNWPL